MIEFARSGEAQGEIYFAKLNLHLISILKCLLLFACFYVLSVLTFTEKESDCSNCKVTLVFVTIAAQCTNNRSSGFDGFRQTSVTAFIFKLSI